jgi:hypothetical protein
MTPLQTIRARVREHGDYETAAEAVLAELNSADAEAVAAWLRAGVYALARTVATQVRIAETKRLAHEHNGDPARIVVRVPVAFGKERRFRSATLAECGKTDLLSLAALLEAQAQEDMAKARAYRRLARALDRHGVATVAELAPTVVAGAFEDESDDERVAA